MRQTEDRWDGAVNHRRKKKHMSGKGKCSYITVSNVIEKEETRKAIVPEPLLLRSGHIGAYPTGKKIHSQPQTPSSLIDPSKGGIDSRKTLVEFTV